MAEREGHQTRIVAFNEASEIEGEGLEVAWVPKDDQDRLRVAIRTRGGVAVLSTKAPT